MYLPVVIHERYDVAYLGPYWRKGMVTRWNLDHCIPPSPAHFKALRWGKAVILRDRHNGDLYTQDPFVENWDGPNPVTLWQPSLQGLCPVAMYSPATHNVYVKKETLLSRARGYHLWSSSFHCPWPMND